MAEQKAFRHVFEESPGGKKPELKKILFQRADLPKGENSHRPPLAVKNVSGLFPKNTHFGAWSGN